MPSLKAALATDPPTADFALDRQSQAVTHTQADAASATPRGPLSNPAMHAIDARSLFRSALSAEPWSARNRAALLILHSPPSDGRFPVASESYCTPLRLEDGLDGTEGNLLRASRRQEKNRSSVTLQLLLIAFLSLASFLVLCCRGPTAQRSYDIENRLALLASDELLLYQGQTASSQTPGNHSGFHTKMPRIFHTWQDSHSLALVQPPLSTDDGADLQASALSAFETLTSGSEVHLWSADSGRMFISHRYPWFLAVYDRYSCPEQRSDALVRLRMPRCPTEPVYQALLYPAPLWRHL
jgi:hypothetical protein